MAGLKDFLFGSGALKKASGKSDDEKKESHPAGIDIGKMAEESAERERPKFTGAPYPLAPSGKSPLSTTMTPHKKAGK